MRTIKQLKRGKESEWIYLNPTLLDGEAVYVRDKNYLKIGDGIKPFTRLPILGGESECPEFNLIAGDNITIVDGVISALGQTGPKGEKGEKGDTGDAGPQGIIGVAGPQGIPGATGPTGLTGPKGDKGDKGDPGEGASLITVEQSESEILLADNHHYIMDEPASITITHTEEWNRQSFAIITFFTSSTVPEITIPSSFKVVGEVTSNAVVEINIYNNVAVIINA